MITEDNQKTVIRIPHAIHQQMLNDLCRPHAFADERIGFLYTKSKVLKNGNGIILGLYYTSVEDENYIEDEEVGAKINSSAIRSAMQNSFNLKSGCFHVHLHEHHGIPRTSETDRCELPGIVRSLANIAPTQINGYIILSNDSAISQVQLQGCQALVSVESISVVGDPFQVNFSRRDRKITNVYDRQSFLGPNSQFLFENIRVGIIGYGGGGSHVGIQLAHLGIGNIMIFDNDIVEETNLNRLIGARFIDSKEKVLKTEVAKRVITSASPTTNVLVINSRWQDNPEYLQECDIIIGCVDSYAERQQAESECRRYLIPYIDIGMDV